MMSYEELSRQELRDCCELTDVHHSSRCNLRDCSELTDVKIAGGGHLGALKGPKNIFSN